MKTLSDEALEAARKRAAEWREAQAETNSRIELKLRSALGSFPEVQYKDGHAEFGNVRVTYRIGDSMFLTEAKCPHCEQEFSRWSSFSEGVLADIGEVLEELDQHWCHKASYIERAEEAIDRDQDEHAIACALVAIWMRMAD